MLARAWIANPNTADGLIQPRADAAIAEPCLVDLATKRIERLYDPRAGRLIELAIVDDVMCGGWLPMGLLILEP